MKKIASNMEPCGCWTDEQGYWQLSDKCREAELEGWRRILERLNRPGFDILEYVNGPRRTTHENAVAYFRQELGRRDME